MKNLLMIAPQASAATPVLAAAQCGQRVNEWGQAGGNSPPLMPPSGHHAGGELSPACPHARLRHSRFVHTESAHANPQTAPLRAHVDPVKADRRPYACNANAGGRGDQFTQR